MTTKLSAVLNFGGKIDSSLRSSHKSIRSEVDRLGDTIASATKRQNLLAKKIREGRREGRNIADLERQYRTLENRIGKIILKHNRLRVAQQINLKNAAKLSAGIGAGALQAGSRAQAFTGAPGAEQGVDAFKTFDQGMIRLGDQAELSAEAQKTLKDRIIETSNATNVASLELLAGVAKAQEKFSDTSIVADNMGILAKAANALDASFSDTVNAIGQFGQNMGVAKDQIPNLLGAMEQAQRAGAITVADVASTMAQSIGLFASVTGQSGIGGARSFLASSQVLAKSGANREQVRTQLEALMGELMSGKVRGRLARRTSGDVRSGLRGQGPIDLAGLIEQLATDPRVNATALGEIFGSKEAVKAMVTMIEQTRAATSRGQGAPLRTIAAVDASTGLRNIDTASSALVSSASGQLENARIEAENRYIQNSENLAENAAKLSRTLSQLTGEFPALTEAVRTFGSSVLGIVVASKAGSILGGGKAAGGMLKTLGGIAKTGGIGASAKALGGGIVSKLGALNPIGKVAAAGAGGYAIGTAANKFFDLENKINDFFGVQIAGQSGDLPTTLTPASAQKLVESTSKLASSPRSTEVNASITVNAAPGQDADAIAEQVVKKLDQMERDSRDTDYGG